MIETLQIYTLKTMQTTLIEIEPGFPTKFNQHLAGSAISGIRTFD